MTGDKPKSVRLMEPDDIVGKVDQKILLTAVAGRDVGTVDSGASARKRKPLYFLDNKPVMTEKIVVVIVAQISLA